MTVSQMSIQNTTPSPAALAQRAGALGNARCANRIGRVDVVFPRRCPNGCSRMTVQL